MFGRLHLKLCPRYVFHKRSFERSQLQCCMGKNHNFQRSIPTTKACQSRLSVEYSITQQNLILFAVWSYALTAREIRSCAASITLNVCTVWSVYNNYDNNKPTVFVFARCGMLGSQYFMPGRTHYMRIIIPDKHIVLIPISVLNELTASSSGMITHHVVCYVALSSSSINSSIIKLWVSDLALHISLSKSHTESNTT